MSENCKAGMMAEGWTSIKVSELDALRADNERLSFLLTGKEQQVESLEEYMLKGVAFRDELQARIKELESQLCRAREGLRYYAESRLGEMARSYLDELRTSAPCRHEAEAKRLKEAEVWMKASGVHVQGGVGLPFCASWTGLDQSFYGNTLIEAVLSSKTAELRRRATPPGPEEGR